MMHTTLDLAIGQQASCRLCRGYEWSNVRASCDEVRTMPEVQNPKRALLVMLLTVAVAACVTFGASALVVGPPAVVADGITYSTSAVRLLNTGVYTSYSLKIDTTEPPDAMQAPGYSLLLAGIYRFLPHTGDPIRVIAGAIPAIVALHFLCAVLSVVLISLTAHMIGGLRLGWIAGILSALYLPFGAEAMSAWPESVRLLLTATCILMSVGLYQSDEERSVRWMVAYGLAGGLTAMVMPAIAPWLVVPICFWGWKRRASFKRAVAVMLVGVAAIAIALSPWIVRNAVTLNRFIPLTQHVGTVWLDSIGGRDMTPAEARMYVEAVDKGEDGFKAVAFDRLKRKWNSSPSAFIVWKLNGAWTLVSVPWVSQQNPFSPLGPDAAMVAGDNYHDMSKTAYTRWTAFMGWIHRIVLALGVAGLVLMRRRGVAWLLASGPVVALVLNTILLPWPRYFYPWMPAVLVLASMCVASVVKSIQRRGDVAESSLFGGEPEV